MQETKHGKKEIYDDEQGDELYREHKENPKFQEFLVEALCRIISNLTFPNRLDNEPITQQQTAFLTDLRAQNFTSEDNLLTYCKQNKIRTPDNRILTNIRRATVKIFESSLIH